MTVDIKAAKAELLEAAGGSKPPEAFVRQNDIMDMMLTEYFNPASRVPQSMTLNAIVAGASISKADADGNPMPFNEARAKTILDKYKP
ncbi:MAG: hypothetical protein IT560_08980 [Alphaproteobacteria bacterium]|nr:hypothetical protein [Alphaproteobacteria bacterium]